MGGVFCFYFSTLTVNTGGGYQEGKVKKTSFPLCPHKLALDSPPPPTFGGPTLHRAQLLPALLLLPPGTSDLASPTLSSAPDFSLCSTHSLHLPLLSELAAQLPRVHHVPSARR